MEFRACCCIKPRTAAIIAGILDLLIGLVGLFLVSFTRYGLEYRKSGDETNSVNGTTTTTEQPTDILPPSTNVTADMNRDNMYINDLLVVNYLYAFSALMSLAHGIILLFAAGKKNSFLTTAAIGENCLRILGCVAGTIGLFILGYHWHLLFPMPFAILFQIYFFWIVFDYQKYFNYTQPLNVKPRA